jgi:hypothetical protein
MMIEKMPSTIPLSRDLARGYRAHARVPEGLEVVSYYGYGATFADAISNCMEQVQCRHIFKPAAGMQYFMRCVNCRHLRPVQ